MTTVPSFALLGEKPIMLIVQHLIWFLGLAVLGVPSSFPEQTHDTYKLVHVLPKF